ncbi:MAG: glycosyltransferase family 4 protein [Anaerolineae bacterium]|nr:glycosyltransferase family 4 protein [Anaerolineae bacterium]
MSNQPPHIAPSKATPLKIAINAQLVPGSDAGGVEGVLIALVKALGQLTDGPEEYTIIGPWQQPDWLQPYLGPNQRIVAGPRPKERFGGRVPRPLRPAVRRLHHALLQFIGADALQSRPLVPVSDGFYENLGCEAIHFPFQQFVICALPSIFNPHDLQHRHFPQFFTPRQLLERETLYPAACHFSQAVAVASQWIKGDVMRQYHVDPSKVQVIPFAPFSEAYVPPTPDVLATVRQKYALAGSFALYPAVTWPHKNHLRLLDALAHLRDRDGVRANLVCTGFLSEYYHATIKPHIAALGLGEQVRFLGLVPRDDLRALYRLADFVVSPSLFEAASSMMFEAWQDGTPVTCSNVTSLPQQAGDAALLFDPYSVDDIAGAMGQMAASADLRADLVARGTRRSEDFTWDRTARAYRALYRRLAGRVLSDEDQDLLAWDWMQDPRRNSED